MGNGSQSAQAELGPSLGWEGGDLRPEVGGRAPPRSLITACPRALGRRARGACSALAAVPQPLGAAAWDGAAGPSPLSTGRSHQTFY